MSLLTETQISDELASVPSWTRDGNSIVTVTERADFRDALLYLGAVAYLAETANHHPDITINWNKVTLTLSTHSAGGLTANDFALARQISALSLAQPTPRRPAVSHARSAPRIGPPARPTELCPIAPFGVSNKLATVVSPDLNKKISHSLF
jgi:4a-hydroxytetrahydrobiopterin dehydratase